MDSSNDIQTEGDWIIIPASAIGEDAITSTVPKQNDDEFVEEHSNKTLPEAPFEKQQQNVIDSSTDTHEVEHFVIIIIF